MKVFKNLELSNEDYHADTEHLSSSSLKMAVDSPLDFKKKYVHKEALPSENLEAFAFGSYMHSLVLEPDVTKKEFAIYSGSVRRGVKYDAFAKASKGKTVVTQSQHDMAMSMLFHYGGSYVITEAGKSSIKGLFEGGEKELSLLATDVMPFPSKVRMDYIDRKTKTIRDLKTTSSIVQTKRQAQDIMWRYSYHVSAAYYIKHAAKLLKCKEEDITYELVFGSKKDGSWSVFKLGKETLKEGNEKLETMTKKAQAILSGEPDAHTPRVVEI